jgi:hypothetical protein
VAAPPQPRPAVFVLLVDREPGGGGIIEDQVDIELEQVGRPQEHLLLDRLGLPGQDVEGPIELVDLEPRRFGQPRHVRQPALGAGEF